MSSKIKAVICTMSLGYLDSWSQVVTHNKNGKLAKMNTKVTKVLRKQQLAE